MAAVRTECGSTTSPAKRAITSCADAATVLYEAGSETLAVQPSWPAALNGQFGIDGLCEPEWFDG